MAQPNIPPVWAKLYKVSEVVRLEPSNDSRNAWFQYTLESEYSKIVGKRFGASKEIWEHANARASGLNDRLISHRTTNSRSRKSK